VNVNCGFLDKDDAKKGGKVFKKSFISGSRRNGKKGIRDV